MSALSTVTQTYLRYPHTAGEELGNCELCSKPLTINGKPVYQLVAHTNLDGTCQEAHVIHTGCLYRLTKARVDLKAQCPTCYQIAHIYQGIDFKELCRLAGIAAKK